MRRRARVPHAPGPAAGPFKRRDANGVCRVWRRKRGARSADDGWILTPRRAREGDALAHRGGPGGPGSVTADGGGEGEDRADRVRLMRLPVDPIAKFKSVSRVGGERLRGGAAPAEEEQGERARGGARQEAGGQRRVRGVRDGGVRGCRDWRHRHRARRAGASSGAVENSAEGTEEEAEDAQSPQRRGEQHRLRRHDRHGDHGEWRDGDCTRRRRTRGSGVGGGWRRR